MRSTVGLAAAGLSLIAVCYGLARFAYGLFLPVLRTEFGLDSATAGAIAASSYVGYCVAVVLATLGTARWGPHPVAVTAGVTAAAGTGLIAAAPNAGVLAVGVIVAGSSTGLASPPLADAIARWVVAERADRVQTVVNAGTGLGVMVSGPVALLADQSWRIAWLAFALAAVAVTIWIAVVVPRPSRTDHLVGRRSSERLLADPWFPAGAARLLVAAATMGIGSAAVWTFGRDVVVTAGVSPTSSTVMWIVLGGAGLFGACTGDIAARTGLDHAWVAAMLTLAAATAGLAVAAGSLPAVFASAAVFGAVYIALTGLLLIWGTRVYPRQPAFGVGAAFLLLAAGQALGAPLLGLLIDLTTPTSAFAVAAATLTAGAAFRPAPSAGTSARMRASGPVRLARAIAEQAHAGQVDKAGLPYIAHPARVAAAVAHLGHEAEAVAWLHDVVEDSGYTLTDLDQAGVPAGVRAAVDLLTRRRTVSAAAYYAAIRRDPVAMAVKLADVDDNSDPVRLARLAPDIRSRLERKYAQARAHLVAR